MIKKIMLISLLTLVGSGCASQKYVPTAETMDHFEKGKTTYQEVVTKLGPPNTTRIDASGNRTISYVNMTTDVDPSTLIPIVGLFTGGATAEYKTFTVQFKDDILSTMSYMNTTSHYDMGSGTSN